MQVHMRVRRFNPEKDEKPWWGDYTIDEVIPSETVLDLLHRIKWEQDGTLTLRRSCAHGVCGSDAMRINGQNMLACTTLVSSIAKPGTQELKVQVEPILGLKVIKDLVVDMDPFFDHYKSVQPYFINDSPLPENGRERLQSPEDRARFDDSTKCILCAACTTACPSFWANDKYVGPAAIVQAHRFIFDSRDQGAEKRLKALGDSFGVWRCRTIYNCTTACPRDIKVTQAIAEVKKVLTSGEI